MFEFYDPLFEKVKRSVYGKRSDFLQKIEKDGENLWFISTEMKCLPKSIRVLTGKRSNENYIEINIGFSRRRTAMSDTRVESFCKKVGIDFGYFTGEEVLPRSCKERNKGRHLYESHFCVLWKNEYVSSLKATEEVKKNFELRAACLNYHTFNFYEK